MAGRHGFASERARSLPERGKLHLRVTGGTRDRSLPGKVRRNERSHDFLSKLLLQVQNVMGHAERPPDAPGIGEIIESAAPACPARLPRVIPQLHRETEDLVTLFL